MRGEKLQGLACREIILFKMATIHTIITHQMIDLDNAINKVE